MKKRSSKNSDTFFDPRREGTREKKNVFLIESTEIKKSFHQKERAAREEGTLFMISPPLSEDQEILEKRVSLHSGVLFHIHPHVVLLYR